MRALEDLRTQVRSSRSRKYVDEATAAYGASAHRSAIIAIWIAVTADLIDKFRMLADEHEPAAVAICNDLDKAIESNDKAAMQRFESSVLEKARDDLHLFGEIEYTDLRRIQEDRHLCAHPAYVTDDDLFNPGPERVRSHLSNAVDHLLSHGPVTGKKAIERFEHEIAGPSFPANDERLTAYLRASYLDQSTVSLRTNLSKVVCKAVLSCNTRDARRRYGRAALALFNIIPHEFEQALGQVLQRRQDNLSDQELLFLMTGLGSVPCTWRNLHDGVQSRIEQILQSAPIAQLVGEHAVYEGLPCPPMSHYLIMRLRDVLQSQFKETLISQLQEAPDRRLLDELIQLVRDASGYYQAEAAVGTLLGLVSIIGAPELRRILEAADSNDQVHGSVLANRQLWRLKGQTEPLSSEMASEWSRYDSLREKEGFLAATTGPALAT